MKAANGAANGLSECSPQEQSDSGQGLAGRLELALAHLTVALAELVEAITKQAEAISQLAISNEALANAVTSQPDDGNEIDSGYLS